MKMIKIFSLFLIVVFSLVVNAQQAKKFFPEKDLMTVGIYYYPEHWNPSQWERDIKMISSIGFEFVHLAEFAWAQNGAGRGKI